MLSGRLRQKLQPIRFIVVVLPITGGTADSFRIASVAFVQAGITAGPAASAATVVRSEWSIVAPVVVVVDGHRRGDDQQLTELFPGRNPYRRGFGHRRTGRRTDSRKTRSVHTGNCTVPNVSVVVVVAAAAAAVTIAIVVVAAAIAVAGVVATTAAGTGKNDIVVLADVADCGDCPSSCWLLGAGAVVRFDDLVGDQILRVGLFTPIDDIFRKMQSSS